jgi:CHAD domain-containing protein
MGAVNHAAGQRLAAGKPAGQKNARPKNARPKLGLAFWMERVLEECERAGADFAPDPVHDLRVALRRCRSLGDGLMAMDPEPAWKQMKKAGKRLFQSLGELRDVHVMEEWVHHFDSPGDPVASKMFEYLAGRENVLKQQAALALQEFDRKEWRKWSVSLPRRAGRLRPGSLIFKHLALERWMEAYELHRRALRNQSQAARHSLRIGIKRFRYIVENFLPEQHVQWGNDLKKLQDLLGEVHDLDVLWTTAQQVNAFPDVESRARWQTRIREEREQRLQAYREKMVSMKTSEEDSVAAKPPGERTLWKAWRAELPQGKQIETAALQRLRRWASVLDPDFKHSTHVVRLTLQLYDGLTRLDGGLRVPGVVHSPDGTARQTLRLAAMLHDVGRARAGRGKVSRGKVGRAKAGRVQKGKGHHKASNRLIQRLKAPVGIEETILRMAGVVARYHRGALPHAGQKTLQNLTSAQRSEAMWLAGILRLANAFDADRKGRISRLEVHLQDGFIAIAAQGYSARDRSAEGIAAARHLLEVVCRRPVMVKPLHVPVVRARHS